MNKKIWSFILSFLLVFGMAVGSFAAPQTNLIPNKNFKAPLADVVSSLDRDERAENLLNKSVIRIIIELEKDPIAIEAIKKNIDIKDLSASTLNNLNGSLLLDQKKAKNDISKLNIDLDYHENFTMVLNGFSATTTLKEAKKIEKLKGVKKVSIANEYERPIPLMDTSVDIMDTIKTWELDFKGEGLVVSIIDTGVDPSHKDMKLTNPEAGKLKNKDILLKGVPGKFYTQKVPYGYNYMDNNDIILDLGPESSNHGMHVAGTVGANGKVMGVSPEVQLLAMKVFGNDPGMPSTFGDVIIKAIDDSVKLDADVINMSLGSTSSYVEAEDPEQVAIKNAVDAGVVCSISAGNSNHIGDGHGAPGSGNPDYGVVGSPGLSVDSIQVASIENTNIKADALTYDGGIIGYAKAGDNDPVNIFKGQKVEYIDGGDGSPEFLGEVKGKIALIIRGGNTPNFTDKITNAIKAGASGVIIRNHQAGGDALINMQYPEGGKIPAMFIGYKDGLTLIELIKTSKNQIEFKGDKAIIQNPNAGKMSSFTSWGPTPNLGFKPEITAPGGQIYSTLQGDRYGIMSGTSMAAPHVSGGAALVMERVNKDFNLQGREKAEMVKNLSMSTAIPLKERFGLTSPRRQGAGVMNLYAATTTSAIVTDTTTGISKVELKEIGNNIEFILKVKNFGDQNLTYNIEGVVQTDVVQEGYSWNEPQEILNAPMVYTDMSGKVITSLDANANSETQFKVSIDLTNATDWAYEKPLSEIFANGAFVDGFISLKETTDTQPDLSIPYMGFYGEWDKAPIIDSTVYEIDKKSYYGITSLAWLDNETYRFLGIPFTGGDANTDNIAFSPNGDGKNDKVRPILSFLRNAKEVEVSILDRSGAVVRVLSKDSNIRKNYFDGGRGARFRSLDTWEWDGQAFGEVKEGQYIYQVKAKIDYPNAAWQTLQFPVKVDLTAPVISSVKLDKEAKTITVEAKDNMTPIYKYEVLSKGKVILETDKNVIDFSKITELPYEVTVKAYDYALNSSESEAISMSDDKIIPYVFIETPAAFGTVNTNTILVKGNVVNASNLTVLKINGKDVAFTYNKDTSKYDFETTIELLDGVHKIQVEAQDSSNNEIRFERKIFVDATKPELKILTRPGRIVNKDVSTVKAKIKIMENSGDVKVIVHGNEVFKNEVQWEYTNVFTPIEKELEIDIPLKYGTNDIKIIVEDGFGNRIEQSLGRVFRKTF
nr:S8 family serine peptidase [Tissierella sp.]